MRLKTDWRSSSKDNYNDFCKKHPTIKLTFSSWKAIIYTFNESFRDYILETGSRAKLPLGFGEFTIIKKQRKRVKTNKGVDFINLPVDWQKTKAKGKIIYNFNFDTEGYFFGWKWLKPTVRFKLSDLWYFKPYRTTSRLLATYLKSNDKYQHLYTELNKIR